MFVMDLKNKQTNKTLQPSKVWSYNFLPVGFKSTLHCPTLLYCSRTLCLFFASCDDVVLSVEGTRKTLQEENISVSGSNVIYSLPAPVAVSSIGVSGGSHTAPPPHTRHHHSLSRFQQHPPEQLLRKFPQQVPLAPTSNFPNSFSTPP